ncbi:hypothetical protein ACIBL8_37525 [Streptomyces sp. NPDC050523]|uniref:hypothetical protein n=1 Tax=Streptomyces sp. NPDC050523 TaxID=3365622 RepID=UPI0037A61368
MRPGASLPREPILTGIYAQLSPARRQRLHTGAAAVVSGSAVWLHLVAAAAGAPDPYLAEQLEAVAADEADRGQHAIAGRHLRWAADLSPARDDRERRVVLAYFAFMRAGQGSRMLSTVGTSGGRSGRARDVPWQAS